MPLHRGHGSLGETLTIHVAACRPSPRMTLRAQAAAPAPDEQLNEAPLAEPAHTPLAVTFETPAASPESLPASPTHRAVVPTLALARQFLDAVISRDRGIFPAHITPHPKGNHAHEAINHDPNSGRSVRVPARTRRL